MNNTIAIVLAAGNGRRMGASTPKQYLMLRENPVIYYSLKAFEDSSIDEVILVVGEADVEYCRKEIVERYGFRKIKKIIAGGIERYESVYCALQSIESASAVLIHDGARPMLTKDMVEQCIMAVRKYQACVLGVPVKDTIKISDEQCNVVQTPERKNLWTIQTPQAFSYTLIKQAYDKLFEDKKSGKRVPQITDDAMVVEYALKTPCKIIQGRYENIKVTTPEDMELADIILEKRQRNMDQRRRITW